jgi:hypothetical protein
VISSEIPGGSIAMEVQMISLQGPVSLND